MAEQSPPQWRDKIFHATLGWSNYSSRGGDALPEQYQKPQGISLLLHVDTEAEADRIFGRYRKRVRCKCRSSSGRRGLGWSWTNSAYRG